MRAPSLRESEFFKIHIKHLATSNNVKFEGWVTDFADNFSSTWNETSVYGRMDPLVTFQNTKRDIRLAFDVVSDHQRDALTNLVRINKLISFLYPVYEKSSRGVQNTLNAAPLIGLKWTNLINNAVGGEELIGYIDGINYAPDMGEGGFTIMGEKSFNLLNEGAVSTTFPDMGVPASDDDIWSLKAKNTFIPKKINISFSFKVLHTHMVGWNGGTFGPRGDMAGSFPNAPRKWNIDDIDDLDELDQANDQEVDLDSAIEEDRQQMDRDRADAFHADMRRLRMSVALRAI